MFKGSHIDEEEIKEMTLLMFNRGPDEEGYFIDKNIGLGIRRLAIIDIKGGRQPVHSEDGRFTVVHNGEIYNYIELRADLERKGHLFKTKSDTEVIVHLFEESGSECVKLLNGMFAFAVWDAKDQELFLFRDRMGIKPLFYKKEKDSFSFSSLLFSLTQSGISDKDIHLPAFLQYMNMSYISYPNSAFKNIYKLEPGHFLRIKENGFIEKKRYWEINKCGNLHLNSLQEYKELILDLMRSSIKIQLRSDVPVGTFLSGGIDSSAVVALISEQIGEKIDTFSVGFKGGVNELPYAGMIARRFKTNHFELLLEGSDIMDVLSEVIENLDEPLFDNAMIPTLLLSKVAVSRGIKVILNGTGGDEVFGGYNRYILNFFPWNLIKTLPYGIRIKIGNIIKSHNIDRGEKVIHPPLFYAAGISGVNYTFLKKAFRDSSYYDKMIEMTIQHYEKYVLSDTFTPNIDHLMSMDLQDYLVNNILSLLDKMTMAVSLEGRVPILDHRLVETCYKIPYNIKFHENKLKGIMRESFKEILPNEILHLPKAGFSGPTEFWVSNFLRTSIYKHLLEEPVYLFKEILDLSFIKEVLNNVKMLSFYSESLYALYIFTLWYKRHVMREVIIL